MIRILVVDDLKALLEMVKYILETNPDFFVDTATSGEEALALTRENFYDLIISDYAMPEMSGLELLKILRDSGCTTPFVIQTGQGDENVAIEALEQGADYFLEKGSEGSLQYLGFTQIINLLVLKKRTDERLRECTRKFVSLFEAIQDGLILFDSKGFILEANTAFLEMSGYSDDEIKNLKYWDIISGNHREFDVDVLKDQLINDGYSEEYQLEYMSRNGTEVKVSVRAYLVDKRDSTAGVWVIVRYV
jgi:PAS domain S-box-containing protein